MGGGGGAYTPSSQAAGACAGSYARAPSPAQASRAGSGAGMSSPWGRDDDPVQARAAPRRDAAPFGCDSGMPAGRQPSNPRSQMPPYGGDSGMPAAGARSSSRGPSPSHASRGQYSNSPADMRPAAGGGVPGQSYARGRPPGGASQVVFG